MIVNLFDSNFGEHPGSTAYQPPEQVTYAQREMEFDGVTLFTDEWMMNPIVDKVQSRVKVGWLREPRCLHPDTYGRHLAVRRKFDYTLTYDNVLLAIYKDDYRFCPYGGSWVDRHEWGIPPKTRGVSMLLGTKMSTTGHHIRRAAAELVNGRGVDLYGALGLPVDYSQATKMAVLRDYAYSIVTETCHEVNLWTEWVGDCLALGTVPVLWGCPNIADLFDPDGFVLWDDLGELEAILPTLTAADYARRWPAIAENQRRMEQYRCMDDWIATEYWGEM